jgi:hypothetical protein
MSLNAVKYIRYAVCGDNEPWETAPSYATAAEARAIAFAQAKCVVKVTLAPVDVVPLVEMDFRLSQQPCPGCGCPGSLELRANGKRQCKRCGTVA